MIDLNDVTFEQQADGTFIQVDDPPKRADMVAVVRCRDCSRMEQRVSFDGTVGWFLCTHFNRPTRRDGFCAWGERRDV